MAPHKRATTLERGLAAIIPRSIMTARALRERAAAELNASGDAMQAHDAQSALNLVADPIFAVLCHTTRHVVGMSCDRPTHVAGVRAVWNGRVGNWSKAIATLRCFHPHSALVIMAAGAAAVQVMLLHSAEPAPMRSTLNFRLS